MGSSQVKNLIVCIAVCIAVFQAGFARAELLTIVDVDGGNTDIQNNIRAHLSASNLPCSVSERRLIRALRGAGEEISSAMRALGYYRSSWRIRHQQDYRLEEGIGKKLVNLRQECWRVTININPGKATLLTSVEIQLSGDASQDSVFKDYLASLPLKEGQQLNHAAYDNIKRSLSQQARNRGYLDAKFLKHILQVDPKNHTALVAIHFDSGPRYRFGEIHFTESPLDDALLRRFMSFTESDPFNSDQLIEFQSNLISSGYFDTVSVDQGNTDQKQNRIPINVVTQAKKRYETTAGIGASTDTGPRLSYGLQNRRVNPRGDSYHISSQLSPVQSNLGFQYSQPRTNPLKEKLQWSTGIETEDTDTTESTSFQAKVALIDEVGNNWLQTSSLRFLHEDYTIADADHRSVLLIPEISWVKSRSNNPRYPTRGWRISGALRGTLKEVISDISMLQASGDAKFIWPLLGGRLISRGGVGATALDEFDELPSSLRFFAGGDNSVRGYGYKDLGPEDSDGVVIGGQHRLTGSLEYDHKVWRDFALAGFYDAGNAFDTHDVTLYHSAGVGFRWFSPIGPIRVDFGFPLKEGGYRLHLSMGPDL
jgi:translocation and assembly module TamA